MSQHAFQSNKIARDLCEQFGLEQCVVLGFSDARGYEVIAAGANETDAQIAKAAEDVKGKTELDATIAYLQALGLALK